jgi:hypothetical protein
MIPSDHFVRMYNELFKMLEEQGHEHLQKYWMRIAGLQTTILGPFIEKDGLKGMYDYWEHIRIEENCDADLVLTEDYFEFKMNKCPSLGKVLDNDAGAFELYCDHCAGWVQPVISQHGFYYVSDIISRTEPHCSMRVYKDKKLSDAYEKTITLPAKPY